MLKKLLMLSLLFFMFLQSVSFSQETPPLEGRFEQLKELKHLQYLSMQLYLSPNGQTLVFEGPLRPTGQATFNLKTKEIYFHEGSWEFVGWFHKDQFLSVFHPDTLTNPGQIFLIEPSNFQPKELAGDAKNLGGLSWVKEDIWVWEILLSPLKNEFIYTDCSKALWKYDLVKGVKSKVSEGYGVAWSNTGKWIVFKDKQKMFLMGKDWKKKVPIPSEFRTFEFSHDDKYLFCIGHGINDALYQIDEGGLLVKRDGKFESLKDIISFRWSPKRHVAAISLRAPKVKSKLAIWDMKDDKIKTFSRGNAKMEWDEGQWSPRGDWCACYGTEVRGEERKSAGVYLLNANAKDSIFIEKPIFEGQWSPDGKKLLLRAQKGNNYLYSVDKRELKKLSIPKSSTDEYTMAWMPDSHKIVVGLDGKLLEHVVRGGVDHFVDEDYIYQYHIYLFDIETEKAEKLI